MAVLKTLFLIVAVFLVVYLIYHFFTKHKYHLSGLQKGTKSKTIHANKLPVNKGSNNYAYSIWFYVNDWSYRLNETKVLLSRGDNGDNNPLISLAALENNLDIAVSTYGAPNSGSHVHTCSVRNFPIQKWVNLTVSLNGRTLDVYIDGKLVRTCILPGVAKINLKADVKITPATNTGTGFNGFTSNLQYFAHPLNPQEAYNIYKQGYGGSALTNIFEKYKLKISYLVNNHEEGSFEI
jgi:hypothetical protein